MDIFENSHKTYTGIDTIIKTEGYYYQSCQQDFCKPIIFTKTGEFMIYNYKYQAIDSINNHINSYFPPSTHGIYTLNSDTIKVKWAYRYDLGCYIIIENKFKILSDSILLKVFSMSLIGDDNVLDTSKSIYKFRAFSIGKK